VENVTATRLETGGMSLLLENGGHQQNPFINEKCIKDENQINIE